MRARKSGDPRVDVLQAVEVDQDDLGGVRLTNAPSTDAPVQALTNRSRLASRIGVWPSAFTPAAWRAAVRCLLVAAST